MGKFEDGTLTFKALDWIEWQCDYNNTEDRTISQGGKTSDEMCMLLDANIRMRSGSRTAPPFEVVCRAVVALEAVVRFCLPPARADCRVLVRSRA